MKKKMLGMVIDLVEKQIYGHSKKGKSYASRRYNVFFDDGSVLSLWEQGDTSPFWMRGVYLRVLVLARECRYKIQLANAAN